MFTSRVISLSASWKRAPASKPPLTPKVKRRRGQSAVPRDLSPGLTVPLVWFV
jgi:hypothetical protein